MKNRWKWKFSSFRNLVHSSLRHAFCQHLRVKRSSCFGSLSLYSTSQTSRSAFLPEKPPQPLSPPFINLLTKSHARKCAIDLAFSTSARGKNATNKLYEELFKSTAGSDCKIREKKKKQDKTFDYINPPLFILYDLWERNNEPSFMICLYL